MKYNRKTVPKYERDAWKLAFIFLLLAIIAGALMKRAEAAFTPELVSSLPDTHKEYIEKTIERCPTEKCKIYEYIVEKFQDDAANFITMIRKCENSQFDQSATNHNRNGTVDYGVAQINSIHIAQCGEEIKTDWKANIDCAYRIYQQRGFEAWACSHTIGIKSFWQ